MEQAILVENVRVEYDNTTALDKTSITIPYGTFTGVIGMNGAGKSTLFKLIMGLVKPMEGKVRVCGDVPAIAQKHGHVAYVPQNELVDWNFPISVYEVVMMGRIGLQNMLATPTMEDRVRVQGALEKLRIESLADRQIGELSGGQKKRVFVARALAQGADVLILDEPFAGLDRVSEESLTQLLVSLKEEGKTILLATHELTSLPDICDHVALIKKTVIAHGPTKDVFTRENVTRTFDGVMHHLTFNTK